MSEKVKTADPAEFVRPELRALGPYTLDQVECRHKLDQNEVPWDLPRRFKEEAAARLIARCWAHYPDFHSERLRIALAELHRVPAAAVLVGNGSNELLGLVLEAITAPGTEVLGAEPSFGLYPMFVRRAGGVPRFVPPRQDLRLPIAELLEAVAENPRRPLLLCSPNNPTGDAATPDQIASLLERLKAPLLLDNAYGEFCRFDYRPLLERFSHLVLLRTLSKAWSLAGLRLGYLLADPRLVAELIKVKLPYNVGHAGQVIGEVVLENPEFGRRAVGLLRARRDQWLTMLTAGGFEVFASEGNFLLARSARSAELRLGLAERGILVRDMGHYPGLAGCLRFAIGSGRALRDTRQALVELGAGPVSKEASKGDN